MTEKDFWNDENLIKVLRGGGVAVMPTDTIYGLVGSAKNTTVVERLYKVRQRPRDKPFIILIGDKKEINNFDISFSEAQEKIINEYWEDEVRFLSDESRPTTIVLDCTPNSPDSISYLHRTDSIAFRLPNNKSLREFLLKTGPLLAPSANISGQPVATNISEAKKYFGSNVDLYIDGGTITGKASKVMKLHKDGTLSILRE